MSSSIFCYICSCRMLWKQYSNSYWTFLGYLLAIISSFFLNYHQIRDTKLKLVLFTFFQKDINECSLNTHNCDNNAACTNTNGSFSCACKIGYSGDGQTCQGERIFMFVAYPFIVSIYFVGLHFYSSFETPK